MQPFDKQQKEQYINYLTNPIIRFCDFFNFSSKNVGYIIRFIHVCLPVLLFVMLCYCSQSIASLAGVLGTLTIISLFFFRGCVISMVETRLCNDTFNICDPLIMICNMEPNNKNRMLITIFVMSSSLLFFLGLYYNKFISPVTSASAAGASAAGASAAGASAASATSATSTATATAEAIISTLDIPEMKMTTSL